jgi:hypothetical protein
MQPKTDLSFSGSEFVITTRQHLTTALLNCWKCTWGIHLGGLTGCHVAIEVIDLIVGHTTSGDGVSSLELELRFETAAFNVTRNNQSVYMCSNVPLG